MLSLTAIDLADAAEGFQSSPQSSNRRPQATFRTICYPWAIIWKSRLDKLIGLKWYKSRSITCLNTKLLILRTEVEIL